MPGKKESQAERRLRGLVETPKGATRTRRVRNSLRGMRIPLSLQLFAGEILELGDLAKERGESTEVLAARLIRVAWEALVGSPLGWSYDITPESREDRAAVERAQRKIQEGSPGLDLPQEEALEEPRSRHGSLARAPEEE